MSRRPPWTRCSNGRSSSSWTASGGNADSGVLYITHNIASVAPFADRVLVMDAGRIVESGPTAALLAAPQQDYTRELLAASQLAPDSRRRPAPPNGTSSPSTACTRPLARAGAGTPSLEDVSLALKARGDPGHPGPVRLGQKHPGPGHRRTGNGHPRHHQPPAGGRRQRTRKATAVQLVFQEPHSSFDPRMTLRASMEAPLLRRRD